MIDKASNVEEESGVSILDKIGANIKRGEEDFDLPQFLLYTQVLIKRGLVKDPEIGDLFKYIGRQPWVWAGVIDVLEGNYKKYTDNKMDQDVKKMLEGIVKDDLAIAQALGMDDLPETKDLLEYIKEGIKEKGESIEVAQDEAKVFPEDKQIQFSDEAKAEIEETDRVKRPRRGLEDYAPETEEERMGKDWAVKQAHPTEPVRPIEQSVPVSTQPITPQSLVELPEWLDLKEPEEERRIRLEDIDPEKLKRIKNLYEDLKESNKSLFYDHRLAYKELEELLTISTNDRVHSDNGWEERYKTLGRRQIDYRDFTKDDPLIVRLCSKDQDLMQALDNLDEARKSSSFTKWSREVELGKVIDKKSVELEDLEKENLLERQMVDSSNRLWKCWHGEEISDQDLEKFIWSFNEEVKTALAYYKVSIPNEKNRQAYLDSLAEKAGLKIVPGYYHGKIEEKEEKLS